ncbi:MAG: cryptochrome/photolyase family protein [Flavobacteriaceae bacterium]|nr:cryptochrome/photolyase family protein [Flavobacteriaceae bacterium]
MTLRLILGDQLNLNHSWFQEKNEDVIYFMAEMRQETDYVRHHIQKVVGFFVSMRNFSEELKEKGHRIIYYSLDDSRNTQNLEDNISTLIKEYEIDRFEYQLPDEYRLDKQLKQYCKSLDISAESFDTEHFFTTRDEWQEFYDGKKQFVMEYFYRNMRKKHGILMTSEKTPEGDKWNYDDSNQKKWKGDPEIPHERGFRKDVTEIVELLKKSGVETIGSIDAEQFSWPTSRADSLSVLNHFCKELLVHFGDYQDAMDPNEKFLFHSRISFALNAKMLSPKEVIDKVIDFWREHKKEIDISQVEGFVRQILGWREYMRGLYWAYMPGYAEKNELNNKNKLPDFFWTGDTKMNCVKHAIGQSLEDAYAHHIQRLMVIGNFALLIQCDPDQVDEWYLGVYIDAIEWVEITNTRGMSQWADGGLVATKPYVSSGSYINKMSNYCGNCHYKVSKKTGEDACPFNSLYWNFLDDKKKHFENNQRMSMMLSMLKKMNAETLSDHKERAAKIIENPDAF